MQTKKTTHTVLETLIFQNHFCFMRTKLCGELMAKVQNVLYQFSHVLRNGNANFAALQSILRKVMVTQSKNVLAN